MMHCSSPLNTRGMAGGKWPAMLSMLMQGLVDIPKGGGEKGAAPDMPPVQGGCSC